jgi:hypothetical protein
LYVDICPSCQRVPENQGPKKEENRRPKYGNGGGGHYVLLVSFGIVEPEKSSFHSVGQNNIEKNHPRQYDGNFAVFGCG